ncbi:MAG: helicase-related protein, partial [Candidatus Njordarchaeota archaeon]
VGITVGIRTGEKKRLRGKVLVTTPESLSVLVFGKNKDLLSDVRFVIIDEVHNSIYSDRGIYLSIVLEFLYEFLDKKPQLVGLSATIPESDRKYVIDFINAEGFIEIKTKKHPYLIVSEALDFQNNEKAICETVAMIYNVDLGKYGISGEMFPSIIFANSRRFTEYLAMLFTLCIKGKFGVIHSDVKKRFREQYINEFEDGELTGIVATQALGEGVDFTVAKGVIQIASPGHPVYLRQRIGRARHRPGEIPVAGVVSLSSIDLLENLAIIGILLSDIDLGFIKATNSISAVAKTIVNALSSSFSFSSNKEKIINIICRSRLITDKDLPIRVFEALEKDGIIIKSEGMGYKINRRKWYNLYRRSKDEKPGAIIERVRRNFYTVIPFHSKYEVVIVGKWIKIGNLDPEFVSTRVRPLMTFQLAGRDLRVIKIDHFNMKIYVEEIEKSEKTVPFWLSPPIVRIRELAQKMLDKDFLEETYNRKELICLGTHVERYIKELFSEITIIENSLKKGVPIVVCDRDEGFSITVFYPAGEGGSRYAAYAVSKYFQDVYGPWRQPDLKISPISFTLVWKM